MDYKKIEKYTLYIISISFILFLINNLFIRDILHIEHFKHLSMSFLQGTTYLVNITPKFTGDAIYFNEHLYWHLGLLPSILLLPFLIVSNNMIVSNLTTIVHFFITLITTIYLYTIFRKLGNSKKVSVYLLQAFVLGTAYFLIAIQPNSWFYSHSVHMLIFTVLIYEFIEKKRYFILGFLIGLLLLTRAPTIIIGLFIGLDLITSNKNIKYILVNSIKLVFPVFCALLILFNYNHMRFGTYFETGYNFANNQPYYNVKLMKVSKISADGLLHFNYIPQNLYTYLFRLPTIENRTINVDLLGYSILLTSPFLLLLLKVDYKNKLNLYIAITCIILFIVLMFYYWTGYPQVSPRYLLDILPLCMYLIATYTSKNGLNSKEKFLIYLSIIVNVYLTIYVFL